MSNVWVSCFTFDPALDLFRPSDTYRGGGDFVAFTLENIIDPSRDAQLTSGTLPAGWSQGGHAQHTTAGVVLTTPPNAGAESYVRAPFSDYLYHDATVDVELVWPRSDSPGPVEIVALETVVPTANSSARVGFRTGMGSDPSAVYAYGESVIDGKIDEAGIVKLPNDNRAWSLQLVRDAELVWGLYGIRDPRSREWLELYPVFHANFGTNGNGQLNVTTRNLAQNFSTRARVSNFTVESHATINNRLVTEKTVPVGKQIRGKVPQADIRELGPANVRVFGLFGTAENEEAFEYVAPEPRLVGTEIVRTLSVYSDPVVRDS